MKLKQLAVACAAALALPAAHAAAPTNAFDTSGALVVYLSGATAPDNFLATIIGGMMNPGFYSYTAGTDFRAYLGEVKNDASIPVSIRNQKVLFIKRSKGGSVWGVDPVARSQGVATLKISNATNPLTGTPYCTTASPTNPAVTVTCTPAGNDPAIAAANGDERIPDFGVSDVAPFMFKEPYNVEFGQTQLTNAEAAALSIRSVNTLMMGIVTTAQVPDTATLSNADYLSMLQGNIGTWSTFGVTPAAGDNVVVCRRWQGSGTQSSYNWYFHNFPCASVSQTSGVSGDVPPVRMTDSAGYNVGGSGTAADPILIDPSAGFTIVENSGSGDVRKCLKAANNGGNYDFQAEDNTWHRVQFGAGGYGAIGVLSLDSQTKTSTSAADGGSESAWFFRPLNGNGRFYQNGQTCLVGASLASPGSVPSGGTAANGVCPNRTSLRNGNYDFAAELTMQWKTASISGAKLDFINEFIDRAGDPAFQSNWTLALPGVYNPNEIVAYDGTKVAKASRNGNQCAPLQRTF